VVPGDQNLIKKQLIARTTGILVMDPHHFGGHGHR
jgi:hypothetical protein